MKTEIVKAVGLSAWASYLINGDSSGINEEDIRQADKFREYIGGGIVDCNGIPENANSIGHTENGVFKWHKHALISSYTSLGEFEINQSCFRGKWIPELLKQGVQL